MSKIQIKKFQFSKKIFLLFVCVFFLGVIVLLIVSSLPFERRPLTTLVWKNTTANVIALNPVSRGSTKGLLLVKLEDGSEQFVSGNWNVQFVDHRRLYFFEQNFGRENFSDAIHLFYFDGGEKIQNFTLSQSTGRILSVQENAQKTYISIKLQRRNNAEAFCITKHPRQLETHEDDIRCAQIEGIVAERTLWDPDEETKFFLQEKEHGTITVVEVGSSQLQTIGKDHADFSTLDAKIEHAFNSQQTQYPTISRIATLARLCSQHGCTVQRVPLQARLAWLADQDHIILNDAGTFGVLELSTDIYAPVITTPATDNTRVILFTQDATQQW